MKYLVGNYNETNRIESIGSISFSNEHISILHLLHQAKNCIKEMIFSIARRHRLQMPSNLLQENGLIIPHRQCTRECWGIIIKWSRGHQHTYLPGRGRWVIKKPMA